MASVSPKVTASALTAWLTSVILLYVLPGADPSVVETVVGSLVVILATFASGWVVRDPEREPDVG